MQARPSRAPSKPAKRSVVAGVALSNPGKLLWREDGLLLLITIAVMPLPSLAVTTTLGE